MIELELRWIHSGRFHSSIQCGGTALHHRHRSSMLNDGISGSTLTLDCYNVNHQFHIIFRGTVLHRFYFCASLFQLNLGDHRLHP